MKHYPVPQKGIFQLEPATTVCDYDMNCNLSLYSFLKYQQDAAEKQVSLLGYDYQNMLSHEMAFLVNKTRNLIYRMPKYGEAFCLHTWNSGTKGVRFKRGFCWYSENGELLAHGCNVYVLVNTNTHRPLRPSALYGEIEEFPQYKNPAFDYSPDMHIGGALPVGEKRITYSELDINRHLNNARYAGILQDNLPAERQQNGTICAFAIDFIKEAPLGCNIQLFAENTRDHTILKGTADGHDRFCARADYEN